MFASLQEQMKQDDTRTSSPWQRMMKWAVVTFVSVMVFSGLYYAIQTLE